MAVLRLAPMNIGTSVALTTHPIHYLCDTTTEMNALTGLKTGDTALAKDTNLMYKAATASSWAAADTTGATTGGPFKYKVTKSGSTFTAIGDDGTTFSGTDPVAVHQSAINDAAADGGGIVFTGASCGAMTVGAGGGVVLAAGVVLTMEGSYGRTTDEGTTQTKYGAYWNVTSNGVVAIDIPNTAYGSKCLGVNIGMGSTTTTTGIRVRAGDIELDRFGIVGGAIGVNVEGWTSGFDVNVRMTNGYTRNCSTRHIKVLGVSGGSPTDGTIMNCRCLSGTNAGQSLVEMGEGGWDLSGCHITNASTGGGSVMLTGGNCQVRGNYLDTCGSPNLTIAARNAMVGENYMKAGTSNTDACILISDSNFRGQIMNNFMNGNSTAKYGIRFSGSHTAVQGAIVGNGSSNLASPQVCVAASGGTGIDGDLGHTLTNYSVTPGGFGGGNGYDANGLYIKGNYTF